MDIEGSEWTSLIRAMNTNALRNVKQLAMEIHLLEHNVDSYRMYYDVLKKLRDYGFYLWLSHENIYTRRVSSLTSQSRFLGYEIVLLNVRFLPDEQ